MSADKFLKAGPQEIGRVGDLNACRQMGWARIPTYYYDFSTHSLPFVDETEFNTRFGPNIHVFQSDQPATNQQTNAAVGSGVNTIFLACAVGVVAIGEGESFAIHGATVPAPAAGATVAQPTVAGELDGCGEYCGVVRGVQPETSGKATLWWGGPTWRFIEKFFQAYRLQVKIQRRYLIVDESLLDVGMTPLPPEFIGASDSRIPTAPFIRQVNDTLREKEATFRFLSANSGLESLAASCGSSDSCYLPPPLAGVTYGHPRIIGLANRIYPLCQPILFLPGMRFDVLFESVRGACESALRATSIASALSPDLGYSGTALGSGTGETLNVPGGCISLGVVMKGIELQPQAAVQYFGEMLTPGATLTQMYNDLAGVQGLMQRVAAGGGSIGRKPSGEPISAEEYVKHAQGVLAARPQEITIPRSDAP